MVRETGVQSQVESYQRLKMVFDSALLNTQHNKVRIKGKVEQSMEWSSALPLHIGVVAIEKGAFGSPSTKVANFTYFIYIYIYLIHGRDAMSPFLSREQLIWIQFSFLKLVALLRLKITVCPIIYP